MFNLPAALGMHESADLSSKLNNLLAFKSRRFPGSQPVSLSNANLSLLLSHDYYVCEKSDGIRYILYIDSDSNAYLVDRKNQFIPIKHLCFPHPTASKSSPKFHSNTVLDGELVHDTDKVRFLIFDMIINDKQSIMHLPLDKRLGQLDCHLIQPMRKFYSNNPHLLSKRPFSIAMKKMERSYALQKLFYLIDNSLQHENDGLIFTPVADGYICGTAEHVLKWKPPEMNTVDFKIRIQKEGDRNRVYLQIMDNGHVDYQNISVDKDTAEKWKGLQPHGKIAEFKKDSEKLWKFVRFRDDKDTANHISVLHKIMKSIQDGISRERLLDLQPEIRAKWKERHDEIKKFCTIKPDF